MSTHLQKTFKKDPKVKELEDFLESTQRITDVEVFLKEAAMLHSQRPSRKLYRVNMAPTPLYEALTRDLSNRARLVEMSTTLVRNANALKIAADGARVYLMNRYREEIKDVASTAAQRKETVDYALRSVTSQVSEYESAIEVLQAYIKDVDQSGFALRNAVELLKLVIERRDQAV